MHSSRCLTGLGAVFAIAAACLLAAGCGGAKAPDATAAASAPSASPAISPGRLSPVAVVQAITRPISASVQVTGSFVAKETSDVAPQAAGRVTETPVDVGDFVQQGQ